MLQKDPQPREPGGQRGREQTGSTTLFHSLVRSFRTTFRTTRPPRALPYVTPRGDEKRRLSCFMSCFSSEAGGVSEEVRPLVAQAE